MFFSVLHRDTHLEDFQTSILTHWRLNTTHFLPKTENWCIASFSLFLFFPIEKDSHAENWRESKVPVTPPTHLLGRSHSPPAGRCQNAWKPRREQGGTKAARQETEGRLQTHSVVSARAMASHSTFSWISQLPLPVCFALLQSKSGLL